MAGWIKIRRDIQSHWIWKDPVKLKWWIDILLTVNHSDTKVNIGYELYECKRGQSIMSLKNWAERWCVSKDSTRNFFTLLEKDGMILHENLSKSTRITVCNYDSYQSLLHDEQTQSKRKANAKQTQSGTNKKEKNIKEGKEYKKMLLSEINISEFPEIKSDYFEVAKSFQLLIRTYILNAGGNPNNIDNAKGKEIDTIRFMFENDKYIIDDFRSVYLFLQKDSFWQKTILSISGLRNNFNTLLIQSKQNGKNRRDYKEGTTFDELAAIIQSKFTE